MTATTRLGLMLNDPEEEQNCFADNTHNSLFYDGVGTGIVCPGRYVGVDGTATEGPSLSDLVAETDADLDAEMRENLADTVLALGETRRRPKRASATT